MLHSSEAVTLLTTRPGRYAGPDLRSGLSPRPGQGNSGPDVRWGSDTGRGVAEAEGGPWREGGERGPRAAVLPGPGPLPAPPWGSSTHSSPFCLETIHPHPQLVDYMQEQEVHVAGWALTSTAPPRKAQGLGWLAVGFLRSAVAEDGERGPPNARAPLAVSRPAVRGRGVRRAVCALEAPRGPPCPPGRAASLRSLPRCLTACSPRVAPSHEDTPPWGSGSP